MVETDFTNQTQQRLKTLLENLEKDHAAVLSGGGAMVESGSAAYGRLIDAVRRCLQNLNETSAIGEALHSREN